MSDQEKLQAARTLVLDEYLAGRPSPVDYSRFLRAVNALIVEAKHQ